MSKAKEFFKSTGFKSVIVLLVICFVCVGLLALLNDVLYVSDEVRFQRAMAKIYPEGENFVTKSVDSQYKTHASYGSVESVAMAQISGKDEAVVIEATGIAGSYGGTITCYVVVDMKGVIVSWSVNVYSGQTYMSKITNKHLSTWYIGQSVSNEISFTSGVMVTGATSSSVGINNAINMACYYARNALRLGSNPEGDAKNEILELLADTDYAGITLSSTSKSVFAHLSDGTNVVDYVFVGTSGNDTIYAFAYRINSAETLEYIVINASYNDSERSEVIAASDGITAEIETLVTENYYNRVARIVNVSGSQYRVIGYALGMPTAYTLDITINSAGAVTAIDIIVDGFVPGDPSQADANKLATSLVGATIETIQSLYNNKVTGATNSADIIYNAVYTALMHYNANNG